MTIIVMVVVVLIRRNSRMLCVIVVAFIFFILVSLHHLGLGFRVYYISCGIHQCLGDDL
jgi:hypothetical protein